MAISIIIIVTNSIFIYNADQEIFLDKIEAEVTPAEKEMLDAMSDKEEFKKTLSGSNLQEPGTDGITSLFYKLCWPAMGDALSEIAQAKQKGEKLPVSMRTTMMVPGTKPKKTQSLLPEED